MSDQDALNGSRLRISANVHGICDRFEAAFEADEPPRIEDLLPRAKGWERAALLFHLLLVELEYRNKRGDETRQDEYLARFTDDRLIVVDAFKAFAGDAGAITRYGLRSTQQAGQTKGSSSTIQVRCPHCHNPIEVAVEGSFEAVQCDACGSQFSLLSEISVTRDPTEIETLGHFELIEWLGTGGFGSVWKARDTRLDRIVALKIPQKGQLSARELDQFLREARAAAQLQHHNIVTIHEIGRAGDTVYIVSDMIRGVSLADWLSAKQMNARESAELCVKVADALEHSHQAGVVHRDLKPQNIMIDTDGEPHLTDFGLARREFGEITVTVEGQVLGTPAYMPPEQASGEGHRADNRADIYSLGVILFRLLTGELPFRGNARMLIQQVLHDEPPSPRKLNSSIPRDLETICLKCLEKEPSKRYQRAREVAEELQRFLRHEPIRTRPLGGSARAWRWCKRNPSVAGLLGAVGCTLLAGCLVSSYFAVLATRSATTARENESQKTEALAKLVDVSKELVWLQQGRERSEGYLQGMWKSIRDTLRLGGPGMDQDSLRHVAVGAMGDFVGLAPMVHGDFHNDITAMGVHPLGELIAVGLENGEIQLLKPLDKTYRDIVGQSPSHGASIVGLEFSQTGNLLISVDETGTVLFWERAATGDWEPTDELKIETGEDGVESVQFAPNHDVLMTRNRREVAVWRLQEGASGPPVIRYGMEVFGLEESGLEESARMQSAAISPDHTRIALGHKVDSRVPGFVIRDTMNRDHEFSLGIGYSAANSLTFSPDGKLFVYGAEQALVVYEADVNFTQQWVRRSDAIRGVAFSSDNQFLAAIDLRGHASVYIVSTGQEVATLSHPRKRPGFQFLAFSADGTYLVSANLDSVKVWHFGGTKERKTLAGHAKGIPTVAISPDGKQLATGSKDQTVCVWDAATGKKLLWLGNRQFPGVIQCVTFSPDGELLATAHWKRQDEPDPRFARRVQIWNLAENELIASSDHDLGTVTRLVFFDSHGRHLAASGGGGVTVWRVENDASEIGFEKRFEQPGGLCLDVAVSPDGNVIAWAEQTKIRAWNLDTDKELQIHPPPMIDGWHGLAFPAERHLIFVNGHGVAQIWDIEKDELHASLGNSGHIRAPHIALSRDGEWFAGLIDSRSVAIWNTRSESRTQLCALRPERAAIWSLAWSPDGSRLALGLVDGGLTIWDLKSVNVQLAKLDLHW